MIGMLEPARDAVQLPLPALLGETLVLFAAEFDRRMAGTEFATLSLAHSRNVLRHLGFGPLRASRLVDRSGVTKQALSQQIAHLESNGFVRVEPDPCDARARLLTLTEKGLRAQHLVARFFVEIENDWAARLGEAEVEGLRRALTTLVRGCAPAAPPDPDSPKVGC